MRQLFWGLTAALLAVSAVPAAASFVGYTEGDVLLSDSGQLDYDPVGFGLALLDNGLLLDVSADETLSTGALTLFDTFGGLFIDAPTLIDIRLTVEASGDDLFEALFEVASGPHTHVIAMFTGDLDGSGTTDFFTDGAVFVPGTVRVVAASADPVTPIPVPGTLPLALGAVGGLILLRRARGRAA